MTQLSYFRNIDNFLKNKFIIILMLNFDDLDLAKLKIKDIQSEDSKKFNLEKLKFYNSRYNNKNLSDYILVNKKQIKTPKDRENKK